MTRKLSQQKVRVCTKCEGTRLVMIDTKRVNCSTCKGKGKVQKDDFNLCKDCEGKGKVDAQYYSRCRWCIDD